jgi:hypothetical protein
MKRREWISYQVLGKRAITRQTQCCSRWQKTYPSSSSMQSTHLPPMNLYTKGHTTWMIIIQYLNAIAYFELRINVRPKAVMPTPSWLPVVGNSFPPCNCTPSMICIFMSHQDRWVVTSVRQDISPLGCGNWHASQRIWFFILCQCLQGFFILCQCLQGVYLS